MLAESGIGSTGRGSPPNSGASRPRSTTGRARCRTTELPRRSSTGGWQGRSDRPLRRNLTGRGPARGSGRRSGAGSVRIADGLPNNCAGARGSARRRGRATPVCRRQRRPASGKIFAAAGAFASGRATPSLRRTPLPPRHLDSPASPARYCPRDRDCRCPCCTSELIGGSYIARHRNPWWKVGLRKPAPILCTCKRSVAG